MDFNGPHRDLIDTTYCRLGERLWSLFEKRRFSLIFWSCRLCVVFLKEPLFALKPYQSRWLVRLRALQLRSDARLG